MPIRINLLAEAQAAEEMRRKDPVKRSIWIGGFAVFVVLLIGATLQFKIIAARSEVNTHVGSWKTIEKQVQEVNDHRNSTRELERKLSALDQFTTNRMLWASALDAFQHTGIEGVQLVRIRTEQIFTLNEEVRGRTNETGQATGKPATVTEKIYVHVEGKDFRAGEQVQRFKESLQAYPYFEARLDKTNRIQLTSLSAPQPDGGRTYRHFALQLSFREKERHLYE
jgi:hypothetical protein